MKKEKPYKRVLLKLSGEVLAGDKQVGIDADTISKISEAIKKLTEEKIQVVIVVGGGNFWRGRFGPEMERTTADYMGMLATSMNGLALQDALEKIGVQTRLQTAIEMREIAEPYIKRKALKHIEKGRVVIFASGTGNPYFTTDTTAALRAAEMDADVILLGKSVDAVYDEDPKINPNAKKFDKISYLEVINKNLQVMDITAITLCKDNKIPIIVFGTADPENIVKAAMGEKIGTIIK